MDKLLLTLSKHLNLHPEELEKIIKNILANPSYEEELLNFLGYDNFEMATQIIQSKDFFIEKITEREKRKWTEIVIEPKPIIHVNENDLISIDAVNNDKKYFTYKKFNPVQSKVFDSAYNTDGNILVSAPTGSGKTDVAFLTILRALKFKGKIIYIVPMKALATEITRKLSSKLTHVKVTEYTGDTDITRSEINKSDIMVCTPEKFDVGTRKQNNIFSDTISLVIIDEIHLLQDDRGPVIESIVSRIFRFIELKQKMIRLVALSATLPNYKDVAKFIKAEHTYNFKSEYRPVPLRISLINVKIESTKEKIIKESNKDNVVFKHVDTYIEIIKEKLQELAPHQVIIFVHSRNETMMVAKQLLQGHTQIKRLDIHPRLQDLVSRGVGVHHAGLLRKERLVMENLFKEKKIRILVSTSTLAWGVNLPAHSVIIKGTTFYDPEKGKTNIPITDVLQIFGRAGRPQYYNKEENNIPNTAYLLTNNLNTYIHFLKNMRPIESRLFCNLINLLNTEIALNTINTTEEAIQYIKNTFFYIRITKNPTAYGQQLDDDKLLDYIIHALKILEENKLIKFSKRNEINLNYNYFINITNHFNLLLHSTEIGRIASSYYIDHTTITLWNTHIEYTFDKTSIIKLLLKSNEFKNITLKENEIHLLTTLSEDYYNIIENNIEEINIHKIDREDKLLLLIIFYLNDIEIKNSSLIADTHFIIKNIKRLLSGFLHYTIEEMYFDVTKIVFELRIEIEYKSDNKMCDRNDNKRCDRSIRSGNNKSDTTNIHNHINHTNTNNHTNINNITIEYNIISNNIFFKIKTYEESIIIFYTEEEIISIEYTKNNILIIKDIEITNIKIITISGRIEDKYIHNNNRFSDSRFSDGNSRYSDKYNGNNNGFSDDGKYSGNTITTTDNTNTNITTTTNTNITTTNTNIIIDNLKILYKYGIHHCLISKWNILEYKNNCKHFNIINNLKDKKDNEIIISNSKYDGRYDSNIIEIKDILNRNIKYDGSKSDRSIDSNNKSDGRYDGNKSDRRIDNKYDSDKSIDTINHTNNTITTINHTTNTTTNHTNKYNLYFDNKINIECCILDVDNYYERMKICINIIFYRSVGIIVGWKEDIIEIEKDIRTLEMLEYCSDNNKFKVCTLEECKKINNGVFYITSVIKNHKMINISELLGLNGYVVIFERKYVLEYLNQFIL
ncbi:DEAD/DEAH box helicase [Spraguea lophii 42_110]|uniref:DEAD/DEAH box helicase n=1 Tax=Spraguea lophii (strain 42_110) TaxID=1358809 RepID=S7XTU6_SPRLO|nr:DEAD/DEAH box helicase [Spraguea lophii 42_110]